MKKINNNGFVLAEAITVGVFILSLFTFLFINIVPLIGKYEAVEQYDTVDAVYNANMVRMIMMENANLTSFFPTGGNKYVKYSAESFCNKLKDSGDDVNSQVFCKRLLGRTYLDVNVVIVTKYRLSELKENVKNNADITRAEREYILSLDNYTQPSNSAFNNYHRIIVEFNDGSFANLEIKK